MFISTQPYYRASVFNTMLLVFDKSMVHVCAKIQRERLTNQWSVCAKIQHERLTNQWYIQVPRLATLIFHVLKLCTPIYISNLLTSFYIRVWTTINIQFLDPENFLGKITKGLWICSVPEKSWLNQSAGLTVALHCQGQLYPSNFVNHPSSTSHYVATYVNIPSILHSTHCTGGHWFTLNTLHSNCHLSDLHCNF